MRKKKGILLIILLVILIIFAFFWIFILTNKDEFSQENNSQIANPAAVYCEEQGFKYEIRTRPNGNQYGVCIFPDNSECSGWSYFCGCTYDKTSCGKEYPPCHYKCK